MSSDDAEKRRIYDEAADWLIQQDHTEDSADRAAGLRQWLLANPAHKDAYHELRKIWLEMDDLGPQSWGEDKAVKHEPVKPWYRWAAAALLVALGALTFAMSNRNAPQHQLVKTGTARHQKLTLEDGSQLHLSAETTIYIEMNQRSRQIELREGEALFSVAPDETRPFVVRTSAGAIAALGTQFNVRARNGEVDIAVVEGRVLVIPESDSPVEVASAEAASLEKSGAKTRVMAAGEIDRTLSWRKKVLEFDDVPLATVLEDLDPYVKGSIFLLGDEARSLRVGGVLRVGEDQDPIQSLARSLTLETVQLGDAVTVVWRRSP